MKLRKKYTNFKLVLVHAEELAESLEQLNRELKIGQADEVIMNDEEEQVRDEPVKTEEIVKPSSKLDGDTLHKQSYCKVAPYEKRRLYNCTVDISKSS